MSPTPTSLLATVLAMGATLLALSLLVQVLQELYKYLTSSRSVAYRKTLIDFLGPHAEQLFRPGVPFRSRMHPRYAIGLGLACIGTARVSAAQALRIYHIDVDQAAATLFVSPGGRTLLVDSGKNGHGSRILSTMRLAGVDHIDFFLDTHYHEDHYGGIDEVVDSGVAVGMAFDRGDKKYLPPEKLSDDDFYAAYQRTVGGSAQQLRRGMMIPLDPEMTVTCMSAGGVVLGENDPPKPGDKENDLSVGLLITFGGFRYWTGGDTETATETKLASRDLVQNVDVYLAHHHGAENGSSSGFLADLQPTVIIISNGSNARFKHPRLTTLNRMRVLSPAPTIYQLNRYRGGGTGGANVADSLIADSETNEEDGTILLTVNQGSPSYTVAYGGRTHTYRIVGVVPPLVAGGVVISRLLPDPVAGPDREAERVTLRNRGTAAVDLSAWFLRDAAGRVWTLAAVGSLAAGDSVAARREGMPMSLDNDGDSIVLLDPAGQVVDSVSYGPSHAGVEIDTGH